MKVFLDCGSRIGESIGKFFSMYDNAKDFSIFMFEPNPVCYDLLCRNPRFAKFEKLPLAVSNRNGKEKLWGCVKTKTSVGATLEHSKAEWDKVESTDFVEVDLIDLSTFIINNFSFNDYIILKLNIEGAEYDVLEGLLHSGAVDKISQFYVDFHTQWLAPEFACREQALRKKFQEIGKPLNGWNY